MKTENKIRLILVDDDTLFISLLADYLRSQNNLEVVKTYHDGEEIIRIINEPLPCDVMLLDLRMSGLNGIETLKELRVKQPGVKVIILSSFYQDSYSGYMLKCGASAFLPKEVSPDKLTEVIIEVADKGHSFDSQQIDQLREQVSGRSPKPRLDKTQSLTERETEVLQLLCEQLTAKEIAEKLFITQRTVEGHKNNLMLKSGAKNLAGLVVFAIQSGIVNTGDIFLE